MQQQYKDEVAALAQTAGLRDVPRLVVTNDHEMDLVTGAGEFTILAPANLACDNSVRRIHLASSVAQVKFFTDHTDLARVQQSLNTISPVNWACALGLLSLFRQDLTHPRLSRVIQASQWTAVGLFGAGLGLNYYLTYTARHDGINLYRKTKFAV